MNAASVYTFQLGYRICARRLNSFTVRKETDRSFVRNQAATINAVMSVATTTNVDTNSVGMIPRDWR